MAVEAREVPALPSGYRPTGARTTWTIVLLSLTGALAVFSVFSTLEFLDLLNKLERNEPVTGLDLVAAGERMDQLDVMSIIFTLAAGIPFLMWFHCMYKNLVPLGADLLRFGTGWAIGGWFVPILGLWRPKQIANDIWRASDAEWPREMGIRWQGTPVPAWIGLWWALYLLSESLMRWAAKSFDTATTLEAVQGATKWAIAAYVAWFGGAALAILLVVKMTSHQERRAAMFAGPLDAGRVS